METSNQSKKVVNAIE